MEWLDWGKAAFDEAKKKKKPILLNISAVWCHWCHTMQRLTYSDSGVQLFIEKNFVPVRVDTDKRPDVNERYNVGGWPSTVVLAHDGEPVSAATYVPVEHMVGFLEDGLNRFKKYVPVKRKPVERKQVKTSSEDIYSLIRSFYDPVNGGFGLEPKFPHPDILEFLVYRSRDADARKMLDASLSAMLGGEFFDHAGGGFFRYAALQNWSIPHFEKVLEDNARLLSIYIQGYRLFKRPEYLLAVNKTLSFLFTVLFDREHGVFYGSQDADEEYCTLPLEKRLMRKHPFVDATIYADWNSALALALFEASSLEPLYSGVAERMLEFLWKNCVKGGVLHCPNSKLFLLKDATYLLMAFVAAFVRTKKQVWKSRSLVVARYLEKFYDKEAGGFFDVLGGVGRLKERRKPVHENSCAALVLNQLFVLTRQKKFLVMSKKTLEAVSYDALMQGAFSAMYALALDELA
ncbi:thioredoxin domain-containing protein [Candidatus Woesearchaeota archaeon]|nr:thioredoxin domain-containing protein [Candidatus Woesearchaeota archaeon]